MSLIITILCLTIPLISIIAIIVGIVFDKKHRILYGILIALILAVVAYNFTPKEEQDLYRYYLEMNSYYKNIDIDRYLSEAFNNTKIIFKALQYTFAQIGNNRLLPFVITFISYSIVFCIILDYAKMKNINKYVTITIIAIFMCVFYHINFISGLAQFFAISIGFLGFYLEYVKNKKGWIYKLLYVIPIFIHISTIFMLAIRVLLKFNYKKCRKFYIIILIMYIALPGLIYEFLRIVPGMEVIATKINTYLLQGDRRLSGIYDYTTLLLLVLYAYIFFSSKKYAKEQFSIDFLNLIEIVILLNLSSFMYRDIFSRVLNLTIVLYNIYLLYYIHKNRKKDLPLVILFITLLCIGLGSVNINSLSNNNLQNIKKENINKNILYLLKE